VTRKSLHALKWVAVKSEWAVSLSKDDIAHTSKTVKLLANIDELERALEGGGDERLAKLAFTVGVGLGKLNQTQWRATKARKQLSTRGKEGGDNTAKRQSKRTAEIIQFIVKRHDAGFRGGALRGAVVTHYGLSEDRARKWVERALKS
jgi:hypothetical protein